MLYFNKLRLDYTRSEVSVFSRGLPDNPCPVRREQLDVPRKLFGPTCCLYDWLHGLFCFFC